MCSSSGLLYKTEQLHFIRIRLDEIRDGSFSEETFSVSKDAFANPNSHNEYAIAKHHMTLGIVQNNVSDISHITPLSKNMRFLVQLTSFSCCALITGSLAWTVIILC
jgi:hypothetical protein